MADNIRTWHAPDALDREAHTLLAKEPPPARASGPAPRPSNPAPPASPKPNGARPWTTNDELGWLTSRIGRRLELVFLDGSSVRGVLVRVARYELLLRDERNGAPVEMVAMKGALAQVREA